MRRTRRKRNFLLTLLINLLLNLEWAIPAVVLLILHFRLNISPWWTAAGLALWLLRVLAGMLFMGWAVKCGSEKDPPKENKNPYSKTCK